MVSRIRELAAGTAEMLEIFGDAALVRHALAFEVALARAQAGVGLIAEEEAAAVVGACAAPLDIDALAEQAAHAGTFAIPLVAELKARGAARVHLGATSQDVADTVLMLQAREGLAALERDLGRSEDALAKLARRHARTPMLARTLLQSALPTTFGLKAAQWRRLLVDARARLRREADLALRLQLGGPAGTLTGMDGRATEVVAAVAAELGLAVPQAPWHGRRDTMAGLGAGLAIVVGALGKIATDIALMSQAEVAEAFEPQLAGRGGSSAMAHKRNPTGCQVARSAAVRTPHLAATLLAAIAGEHERALGAWQAEAPVLADLFVVAHGAAAAMAQVLEGLEIDVEAMRRNLEAAAVGSDLGEAEALVERALRDDLA
ncbi:3-carboxy-cis,cis-muconate cycloisomerase [Phenylobacterium sp. VNQ135]|uniref:3-carboxy-cis,cis-muconate cycloisomerase n=1 Tax=Phenylobacterium sp. VNQ135 TaxID=3400922 RepID=UPI003C00B47D